MRNHAWRVKTFAEYIGAPLVYVEKQQIREFLGRAKAKYAAESYNGFIKTLRRFYRDFLNCGYLVDTFRFTPVVFKPKILPDREQLQEFYHAIRHEVVQTMFLLYCVSGLRRTELLNLTRDQIDFANRCARASNDNAKALHLNETSLHNTRALNQEYETVRTMRAIGDKYNYVQIKRVLGDYN